MDKVPPLKLLVDAQSSPKYRIQQTDGNSSLSEISLCEEDQPCDPEHGDDSNLDQCSLCPNCDQTFTSTSHQCHDNPIMGHNRDHENEEKERQELEWNRKFEALKERWNDALTRFEQSLDIKRKN